MGGINRLRLDIEVVPIYGGLAACAREWQRRAGCGATNALISEIRKLGQRERVWKAFQCSSDLASIKAIVPLELYSTHKSTTPHSPGGHQTNPDLARSRAHCFYHDTSPFFSREASLHILGQARKRSGGKEKASVCVRSVSDLVELEARVNVGRRLLEGNAAHPSLRSTVRVGQAGSSAFRCLCFELQQRRALIADTQEYRKWAMCCSGMAARKKYTIAQFQIYAYATSIRPRDLQSDKEDQIAMTPRNNECR
jgi:hypothetical protein